MVVFVKALARAVATILVCPTLCSFWLRSLFIGPDRALEGSSQALALIPGLTGQYMRRAFLSRALGHCHRTVTVGFGTTFSKTGARLDENVYLGPGCQIGLAHIERDTLLGAGVQVPSGRSQHGIADLTIPIRDQPGHLSLVRVGAGSWIGSGAIVMADVGRGTVVGAGAVVTEALPDQVIAGGVPARVLKPRG